MKISQLSDLQKIELITLYNSGKSTYFLQNQYGVSQSSIWTFLKKNNVTIRKLNELNKFLSEEEVYKSIEMYNSGLSIIEIGKLLNINSRTIYSNLIRNNVKIRKVWQKWKHNKNYFEEINTKEKSYFLGWMISDGCNSNGKLFISIQEGDGYILEIFKKELQYTGNIYFCKKRKETYKNMKSLMITCKKLTTDLSKLGVIPNKTYYTYFPDIPEEFHSHFIRGVFDGDGCILSNQDRVDICGNRLLIEKIQEILMKECGLKKTKLEVRENTVVMKYTGKNQLRKIYEYLYKDCDDLFLTRKREKFEKFDKKFEICN